MRKLVISAVLVLGSFGVFGCQKDSHDIFVERMSRETMHVDARSFVDDVHNAILMDDRPTHLSFFIQE